MNYSTEAKNFKRLTAKSEHNEASDITKKLETERTFEVNYSTEAKNFKRLTAKSEHNEASDITKKLEIERKFKVNYSTEAKNYKRLTAKSELSEASDILEIERTFEVIYSTEAKNFKRLTAKSEHSEASDITKKLELQRKFKVNYSTEAKNEYTSPAMYTHLHGYKFYARVYVSALNYLCVALRSMPGEYDDHLHWLARANFTIELINQQGGESAVPPKYTWWWNKPRVKSKITSGTSVLETSKLDDFLVNNTLHFRIPKVELI